MALLLFLFIPLSSPAKGFHKEICGHWILSNEGLYDGFIFKKNHQAHILGMKDLKSQYYMQGHVIHIKHNLGGEILLEYDPQTSTLKGRDNWTKNSLYTQKSKENCPH